MAALTEEERDGLVGVGHRVVHGGSQFSASVVVDEATLADLHELVDLAPLHMPANLLGIEAARAELPDLAQVAVFDTAFHQTMPPVAYRYAVPADWYEEHARAPLRLPRHQPPLRQRRAPPSCSSRPLEDLRLVTAAPGQRLQRGGGPRRRARSTRRWA